MTYEQTYGQEECGFTVGQRVRDKLLNQTATVESIGEQFIWVRYDSDAGYIPGQDGPVDPEDLEAVEA